MRRRVSKPLRRLTAAVLALALTAAPCTAALAAGETRRGTPWEEMQYVHYETEDFYAAVNELAARASGEDADGVLKLYDELHEELIQALTYGNIAYLHYSADVTDAYWNAEQMYTDNITTEMSDAFCTACGAVVNGPCAGAFTEHVGGQAAGYYKQYVPATERELELADRQSALVNEYYALANASGGLTYAYGGMDWTEAQIHGTAGDMLYERDPDGYWEVSDGLAKKLNDQIGGIFVQLVQVRSELAGIWGYENYAEAAYDTVYGRDYTTADAQMLCDAVKKIAAPYFDGLYYGDAWYMSDTVFPVLSAREQVDVLGAYVGRIDPALEESWRFMTDMGLYDLTDDPDAMDSGYTVTLYGYDSPFIFNRMYGSCYDLDDLSHEFGHFTDAYYNPDPDVVTSQGSYDLFEIHSTGLEALLTAFYGEIYGQGAGVAEFIVLGGLLEAVINGCIQDEFQRRVYAAPDITLDGVNALYADVCREYGMSVEDVDYSWQDVSHNFDSPVYYISYAVSALAALQIWDVSLRDFDGAADMYMDILRRGAYADGYLTVLDQCGLRLFTEEGAVADICGPVIDRMDRLEAAAERAERAA